MSPSTISLYLGPPPPLESFDDFGLWSHFDAIVGDDGFDSPSTFDTDDALPRLAHDDHRELETMGKPPPPSSPPSQQPLVSASPVTSGVAAASILLLLIGKANYRPRARRQRGGGDGRQFCDSCTLHHTRARTPMNSFIGWCCSGTGTTVPKTHGHCSHANNLYTHRKKKLHT